MNWEKDSEDSSLSAFYRKVVALAQINALQSALQMSKMARAIKEMKKKKNAMAKSDWDSLFRFAKGIA